MCQRSRIASGSLYPRHPRPGCRELPVDPLTITAGASRVASDPLCLHAGANTPAGPREWSRSFSAPSSSAFPRFWTGRLLHYQFRGLLSVHSRYDLQTRQVAYATLYTGGSGGFVASTAAPIATGWSDPVPGRIFLPLWTRAFFTTHQNHHGHNPWP
jgi:hypothetical protein